MNQEYELYNSERLLLIYIIQENLRAWSVDERGVDQYYMKYGDNTEVVWNDLKAGENPETAVKREVSEFDFQFSKLRNCNDDQHLRFCNNIEELTCCLPTEQLQKHNSKY